MLGRLTFSTAAFRRKDDRCHVNLHLNLGDIRLKWREIIKLSNCQLTYNLAKGLYFHLDVQDYVSMGHLSTFSTKLKHGRFIGVANIFGSYQLGDHIWAVAYTSSDILT